MMTDDYRSELARAIDARPRAYKCFRVNDFFGLGGKPIQAIGILVAVKSEDEEAIVAAHKHAAEKAKGAGDGAEAARRDVDLLGDAKTVEALYRVCREVDPASIAAAPDDPSAWKLLAPKAYPQNFYKAFRGPQWMRDNLTTDQLAALMALVLEVRSAQAPAPFELTEERLHAVADVCAAHALDDIPEALLAPYGREWLTHGFVLLAAERARLKESVDSLLKEREDLEARVAELVEAEADRDPASFREDRR